MTPSPELDVPGPRLPGDVALMEKLLTAREKTPPAGATVHPLWSEYLEYGKGRVADLRQGIKVKHGRPLEPPLKFMWEVQRIHLIYEGGELKPTRVDVAKRAVDATRDAFPGVEVLFQ